MPSLEKRKVDIINENLYDTDIVELVIKKQIRINGLFDGPKNGREKRRFVLDTRRADCHFTEPEYTELANSGLFMLPEKAEMEELFVCNLYIDNFYHRLQRNDIFNQAKAYLRNGAPHRAAPTIIKDKDKTETERKFALQHCKNIFITTVFISQK